VQVGVAGTAAKRQAGWLKSRSLFPPPLQSFLKEFVHDKGMHDWRITRAVRIDELLPSSQSNTTSFCKVVSTFRTDRRASLFWGIDKLGA